VVARYEISSEFVNQSISASCGLLYLVSECIFPLQAIWNRDPFIGSHELDDFRASFVVVAATHSLILRWEVTVSTQPWRLRPYLLNGTNCRGEETSSGGLWLSPAGREIHCQLGLSAPAMCRVACSCNSSAVVSLTSSPESTTEPAKAQTTVFIMHYSEETWEFSQYSAGLRAGWSGF
jgi:hypothetical protein